MKLRVNVTQAHIDRGIANKCRQCPLALALRDLGVFDPAVYGTYCRYAGLYHTEYLEAPLPKRACKFVQWFDRKHKELPPLYFRWQDRLAAWWYVRPFSFEIEIHDNSLSKSTGSLWV